jgi:Flp pilus assembly protein TadB
MTLPYLLFGFALLLVPPRPRAPDTDAGGSLPLALDLIAAALRAGQPVANALEVAAGAAPRAAGAELRAVAALLRLGADPPEAWASTAPASALGELRHIASRSSVSGARLADAFADFAARLRSAAVAADEAHAQRASVLCAAPLAACFLPAFACVGVIPTLVGLAGETLRAAA